MSFFTNSARLIFCPRLRQMERFDQRIDELQQQQFHYLLQTASRTVWGQRYDFAHIKDYSTFSQRVPLQVYDDLRPYIHRMINGESDILWPGVTRWFAKSSGTTSDKSKFIPVTNDILRKCHYQGPKDLVAFYLRNHPASRMFEGKGLILGGSHSPSPINQRAHQGDLSAVLLQNLNPLVELFRVPRKQIILMNEWESKLQAIVKATCHAHVTNLSGVPSWMLTLIKAILAYTGKQTLTEVWPDLEVFIHGGISFEPYRSCYKQLIPSPNMHYMESYNASEGFFGIQDDPDDPALLLMPDYGVFYEFVPLEELETPHPQAVPLEGVEIGRNYAMVISTPGGLWRYLIGDTVRFTSLRPPKLLITGRTKHYINAFGEELMVGNAEKALAMTCQETGAIVREYTAAPLFQLSGKAEGCHQWLIEFEKAPADLADFAQRLDQHLQQVNSDYEAKRYKEISLAPLQIVVARKDLFYDWMKQKGKLGGQHKVPRLSNNRTLLEALIASNQSPSA